MRAVFQPQIPFDVVFAHKAINKPTLPHVADIALVADLMDVLANHFVQKLSKSCDASEH